MATLAPDQAKLFEEPNFGFLATIMPDGSPHVTAVWLDSEGETIVVNSAVGRVKERNIRRDPRVALSAINRNSPYQQVIVRGEVVEVTEEGAEDHINALSDKYLSDPKYPWLQPGERRIKIRIQPHQVSG